MIEGLFLVRAPFNNSVELNSEMLSARFRSVISWFSGEKKKAGSLARINSIYICI